MTMPTLSIAGEMMSRDRGRGMPWKGRTHCEHGHEYTSENIMPRVDSSGRRCRECHRERGRRWYRERGAALRAARRDACSGTMELELKATVGTGHADA
jgi:hypothetical protein